MHEITLKTWQYISIWQDKVSKIHDGNLKIIESILKMINECTVFNDKLSHSFPELHIKFKPTITSMLSYQSDLDFWHEIQQSYIKDRHWFEICKIIKTDLIHNHTITIKDIIDLPVKLYSSDIRQIINNAKQEYKYERLIDKIKYDVNNAKINVITYKDYNIISEFDLSAEMIEDNLINIRNALGNLGSIPYRDELKEWKKRLSLMQNIIDKMLESQKTWIGLEPTFKNSSLKE